MIKQAFFDRMKEYLGDDYDAFFNALKEDNYRSLRLNMHYLEDESIINSFDFSVSKINYLPHAYYVNEELKFGFHPLHHAGAFYLQDPSAMSTISGIEIKDGSFILDLCASPGGKTLQLAQKNPNGVIIANEIDKQRVKILLSNVERMGLRNVIVTNNKPEDFLPYFSNSFDYILADVPCSGEGLFRKYKASSDEWSPEKVIECHNKDLEIVKACNQLLKHSGILIYSTCTFAKEEDEDIVNYLKSEYKYQLLEINDILKNHLTSGFIDKTYRFYPHVEKGEGQFVAYLKKPDGDDLSYLKREKKVFRNSLFDAFVKANLTNSVDSIKIVREIVYYDCSGISLEHLNVLSYGAILGKIEEKRFVPSHYFFKAFSCLFKSRIVLDYKDELVKKYLHGEQINANTLDGYGVIFLGNIPLGGYKAHNNILNNLYPKGLRNY